MSRKVLVAYATKMGATAGIAEAIGTELRERGHQVDVREVEQVSAWARDVAAAISSVEVSSWHRPDTDRHEAPR